MTEKEKIAQDKIKSMERNLEAAKRDLAINRSPVSEDEELPTICSMQINKDNLRQLEVLNSKEAVVTSLDIPIPAKDYDKREKAEKSTRKRSVKETGRD